MPLGSALGCERSLYSVFVQWSSSESRGLVRRPGIAASVAAAAFFSYLLLASVYIQSASQGRERLAVVADTENSIWVDGQAAAASGGLQVLANVQNSISSVDIHCSTADGFLRDALTRDGSTVYLGPVRANVTVSFVSSADTPDNMTSLNPFNGLSAGELDLAMKILTTGENTSAGVYYSRIEVHDAHLPVVWAKVESVCIHANSVLSGTLSASPPSNCTDRQILSNIQRPSSALVSQTGALGLVLTTGVRVVGTTPCQAALTTSVSELDVPGPLGTFTLSMSETSTLTLAEPGA